MAGTAHTEQIGVRSERASNHYAIGRVCQSGGGGRIPGLPTKFTADDTTAEFYFRSATAVKPLFWVLLII